MGIDQLIKRRIKQDKAYGAEMRRIIRREKKKLRSSDSDYFTQAELDAVILSLREQEENLLAERIADDLRENADSLTTDKERASELKKVTGALAATELSRSGVRRLLDKRYDKLRRDIALLSTQIRNRATRAIYKKLDQQMARAVALKSTEGTRLTTDIQKEFISQEGYKFYMYQAEPSACSICKPLNGKVFALSDLEGGVNAPPMHTNCHCAISPAE